jgi:hypothetical protein
MATAPVATPPPSAFPPATPPVSPNPNPYPIGALPFYVVPQNINVSNDLRPYDVIDAECSIAINPATPSQLIAAGMMGGMNLYYSADGGRTWTRSRRWGSGFSFPCGVANSDPRCAADNNGNFFWCGQAPSSLNLILFQSTDGGVTWGQPSAPLDTGTDKTAMVCGNNIICLAYTKGLTSGPCYYTAAPIKGNSVGGFTTPVQAGAGGRWPAIAVGPNGDVITAWMIYQDSIPGRIFTSYALDGLNPIFNNPVLVDTTTIIEQQYLPAVPIGSHGAANPCLGLAWDWKFNRIFLSFLDWSNANYDTRVFVRWSDDYGKNWQGRIQVTDWENPPNVFSKFSPAIALDQVNHRVGITWYDCRRSGDNTTTQIWGSVAPVNSKAAPVFGPNFQIGTDLNNAFTGVGNLNRGYGEYSDMAFVNNKLVRIWGDNGNTLDIPNNHFPTNQYWTLATALAFPAPSP